MLDWRTFTLGIRVEATNTNGDPVHIMNFNKPAFTFPLVPTGSLIKTSSKLGHELIAGPLVGGQQVVGHKEPSAGTHVEWINSAALRYQFTEIVAPVDSYHGIVSWQRLEQQLGNQWAGLDNCQHTARRAYYGKPDSPTVNGLAIVGGIAFLLWAASRD